MSITAHAVRPPSSIPRRLALAVGIVLHLAVGVFVLSSGLLMPAWAVVALAALWLGGFVVIYRHRIRPVVAVGVPAAIMALWFVTAWAGETFLGWTG